jgi:uncharacterized protein (DUF58 family)
MTRWGAILGGALVLGVAAAALGSLALFAVSVSLLFVAVGAAVAVQIALARVRIERTVRAGEVVEGQPLAVSFAVAGLRGLPVGVELLTQDGSWLPLAPGTTVASVVVDRPGAHLLGPATLRMRDDLGLVARTLDAGDPHAVLVLPEPEAVAAVRRRPTVDPAGDPEPDGLQPYAPGTPMNRVHWAAMARGAGLQERRFTAAAQALPLVVVQTRGARGPGAVDWVSRRAAGHLLGLIGTGGCRVLLPGDRMATTLTDPGTHWPAVHRRLAGLAAGDDAVVPAAGADDPAAIRLDAALAPPETETDRAPLPPGVTPLVP